MSTEMKTNDIVKLGIDLYRGCVKEYSDEKANEALYKALVAANNGSTKLDIRAIRDGKCDELFSIVEQILAATVPAAVLDDPFVKALVEFRNVADGDETVFNLENASLFIVAEIAEGTQAIRRQRIADYTEVPVPTSVHAVRIYEELKRILAGRVDFPAMIDKVKVSFVEQIRNDAYSLWAGATASDLGGIAYFPVAGTYDEDALLKVVQHVEAAAGGRPATLIGTKRALRPLRTAILGDNGKNTIDEQGYVGSFYGSNVVCIPQRHKVGTSEFVFDDNVITIIASGDNGKPIKFVYEGNPLVIRTPAQANKDLTEEYFYADRWGAALAMAAGNSGIGKYEMT